MPHPLTPPPPTRTSPTSAAPPSPRCGRGKGAGGLGGCFHATLTSVVILLTFLTIPTTTHAADWTADTGVIVYAAAGSADGSLVVAGRRDNTVAAFDAAGAPRWQFATQGTVFDVAVSDDGSRVAAASEDRRVYLLDGDGVELWRYDGAQSFASVAISADGAIVIAGSDDRRVVAFDATGKVLWQYSAGDEITETAVYGGKDAYRALAGTRDSRVLLLDAKGRALWERRLDFAIRGLSVTPNGASVIAADDAGNVVLLDGTNGEPRWSVPAGDRANAAAISRDGETVVAATRDGTILVLDAEGENRREQSIAGEINDLSLLGSGGAVLATEKQIISAVQSPDGSFELPQPDAWYVKWLPYLGLAFALALAVAVVLGLRRRPTGERAWRGYGPGSRRLGREIWRGRVSYVFLLPTIILLLIFNYYPAISGIYHAFTVWTPGVETTWVGLDQFRALADDRYFWTGIGNLVILIVTGFLKLILPLMVAELIFHLRSHKLRYAMRTLFVLQVIVPGVVGVLLWVNIYDPNIGLLNQTLRGVGLNGWAQVWLGDSDTALWSIVAIGFPWVSAFALLIFYGGLISIPSEIFDAAEVDGAGAIRRFFNIDLPLLLSQVRLLVILTFIAVVQEFAAVFLTTGGGPGSSTYVPSLELYYQAVRFNNFGLASAISAVLFVVILAGTIINLRYVKSSVEYGV